MTPIRDARLSPGQRQRLIALCDLLVPKDPTDIVIVKDPPDLPPGWVSATIGTEKGRPKHITLDPEGNPE